MNLNVLAIIFFAILGFIYQGKAYLDATTVAMLLPAIVLVALITATFVKKHKSGEMNYPSKQDFNRFCVALIMTVPFLTFLTFIGILDATTLAITIPSAVLIALLVAAARKKGISLSNPKLALQPFTYASGVIFAVFVLNIFNSEFHWAFSSLDSVPSISAAVSFSGNILLTVLLISLLTFGFRVVHDFAVSRARSTDSLITIPLFHTAVLSAALLYLLPICFLVISHDPLVDNAIALKDIYRICVALSTIPLSLMGMAIAFWGIESSPFSRKIAAKN